MTPPSRGEPRPSFACRRPSKAEGAGNAGCFAAPAASHANEKSIRVSHHRSPKRVRHSLRDGFNGFLRSLPGDRAFLPPSPAQCQSIVADLIPASGYQNATTSPSAFHAFVLRTTGVHRIPRPTFVTIGQTPLMVSTGRAEKCF